MREVDTVQLGRETEQVEYKYNNIKSKMKILKDKEFERIGKEFLINNYEKRFRVTKEVVYSAIIGEDKAKVALAGQAKKLDEYRNNCEKNRTFNFSSLRQGMKPLLKLTI